MELGVGSEGGRRGIIAVEEVEGLTGLNNQGTSPEQRKKGILEMYLILRLMKVTKYLYAILLVLMNDRPEL